ncbi:hypothetical protein BD408DRAFT_415880 [Parasitella parasitica]|nr:hypothetical protein BD408DRAFT_415880 [Parasitella parasitica]
MKALLIATFLVCLYVANCSARCDCDATDNACISKCVVEANSCVTSCEEDIECYESCIDDKWPAANLTDDLPTLNNVLDDGASTSKVGIATTAISSIAPVATITGTLASSTSASVSASIPVNQAESSHTSLGSRILLTQSLGILFVCLTSFLIK